MTKQRNMKSALRWLGDFLFGEEQVSQQVRATRPARPQPAGIVGMRNVSGLMNIDRNKLTAGSLQLIGLNAIRNRLGDNWQRLSVGIHRLVESVLQRRLDVTDAYYRVDEESYLVLFTRLQRTEAEFKATVISKEIQALILGEAAAESGITVVSRVTEIDRELVLEKIGSLQELLEHVHRKSNAEGVTATAPGASGFAAPEEPMEAGPDLDSDLGQLFQRTSHEAFLQNCTTRFQPLFGMRRRAFGSYLTIAINRHTGRMAQASDDPLLDRPHELPFALDRFMLGAGMMGLHRMLQNGAQAKVVIAVGYETLNVSRLREVYFARIKDLPEGLRRYLAFALYNIPPGTPASRIAELLAYLRPLASLHVLHIPFDPRLIDIYAGVGCYGFSTAIPSGLEPMRLQRDLGLFARRATLGRHESILANVNNFDIMHAATAAGFGVLWGDAICGSVDIPGIVDKTRMAHVPRHPG